MNFRGHFSFFQPLMHSCLSRIWKTSRLFAFRGDLRGEISTFFSFPSSSRVCCTQGKICLIFLRRSWKNCRCLKIGGGIQGLFEFWLIFLFQFSGNKIVTLESKSIIDIPDNDAIGSKKFSMERSEEISNKRKYHLSNFSSFVREERYFHRFFRIRIFDCIISNTQKRIRFR